MNPLHYDVATHLEGAGFGTLGTDLFGGEWGDADAQILVLDSSGVVSELKDLYEQPGVQILVRGDKREAAVTVATRAHGIYNHLVNLPESVTINECEYKGFEPSSNLAPLGKDKNERHIYTMNFTTYRSVT